MPNLTIPKLAAAGTWRRLGPNDAAEALAVIAADATLRCDVTLSEVESRLANASDGIEWELWEGNARGHVLWAYRWQADRRLSNKLPEILYLSVDGMTYIDGLGVWVLRLRETAKRIGQTKWKTIFFDSKAQDGSDHPRYLAGKALADFAGEEWHKTDKTSVRFIYKVSLDG